MVTNKRKTKQKNKCDNRNRKVKETKTWSEKKYGKNKI